MAYIKCPSCQNTNTWAKYQHAHINNTKTWEQRAEGDPLDSVPHPQPCPNDGVKVPPVSMRCGACGNTVVYAPPQG